MLENTENLEGGAISKMPVNTEDQEGEPLARC